MKGILKIIAIVIAFLVGSQAVRIGMKEYRQYSKNQSLEKSISSQISKLNDQTPIKVDAHISITQVKKVGKVIEYVASLSGFNLDFIDVNKLKKSQRVTNTIFVCNNKGTKFFLNKNYDIKYSYFSPKGVSLFSHQIAKSDCSNFYSSDPNVVGDYYVSLQRTLLPFEIDDEIVLVDLGREGKTIELKYKLTNYSKSQLDIDTFHEEVSSEDTRNTTCTSPDLKILVEKEFEFKFIYLDKNEELITSVIVSKEMCETLRKTSN